MDGLEKYKAHVSNRRSQFSAQGTNSLHVHNAEIARSAGRRTREPGHQHKATGITGIFAGGTEFTPQYTRFAMEELLGKGVYLTPTYGNTLMGLCLFETGVTPDDGYKITYFAPQPRAVIEVVSPDDAIRWSVMVKPAE